MSDAPAALPWRLEDIDLAAIDRSRIDDEDTLFFLLATSSFVESASDLYTRNLSEYYSEEPEVVRWLNRNWEHEELQHGRALRAYLQALWPDFDWESANRDFFADYGARCTLDEFEPTRGLEMAARCVVETGTAAFYRTLHSYTSEPVLKTLTAHIKSDEVRHYSYFWHFFQVYQARDSAHRWHVFRAVARRVAEARDDDGLIAFRHAWRYRFPARPFELRHYQAFQKRLKRIFRHHFPVEMAVKMLMKPLELPAWLQRPLVPVLTHTVGVAFL